MDIKVEDGNLVVSIPLEDVNNAENKEDVKMGIKVEDGNLVISIPLEDVNNAAGNNGRPLKWMKDRRYRIYIPFSEDEHDHLVKWAIKR